MKQKTKGPTKAQLARQVKELHGQLAYMYHAAASTLHKAGQPHRMASGVLLELTGLGGTEIITPIVIRDGLSDDTIAALRRDICRSYEIATAFKPKC